MGQRISCPDVLPLGMTEVKHVTLLLHVDTQVNKIVVESEVIHSHTIHVQTQLSFGLVKY